MSETGNLDGKDPIKESVNRANEALSPIAKKIKEAYNAGVVDEIRKRHGEEPHHPSDDEYAHRKAQELYVGDEEIDVEEDKRDTGDYDYCPPFREGAKWLRDRLFNKTKKNE